MNIEAQRIAIAEACGWKQVDKWGGYTDTYRTLRGPADAVGAPAKYWGCIPDYLNDLNAMHEAEKTLDATNGGPASGNCLRYAYSRQIYQLVPEWIQPVRATAAQRAEAFLRTIGKWEDGK